MSSALDVLRQIKNTRRAEKGHISHRPVEWGSADFINAIGVEKLNGRELRNHLEARELDSTTGTRLELIQRLRISLKEEQLATFAYRETIATEDLLARELEERGSVYGVGENGKGQLGLGDALNRRVFTAIKRLRGSQVSKIDYSLK